MLKKRLIFTLLVDDQNFVLSRNFGLQKVGNYEWFVKNYNLDYLKHSIDELIILNVSREKKNYNSFLKIVDKISKKFYCPLALGGGINSHDIAKDYFSAGADKLIVNTLIFKKPKLVKEFSNKYGKQSIVGSIDYVYKNKKRIIFNDCGRKIIIKKFSEILKKLTQIGIGELYLTCIDKDGTGQGLDLVVTKKIYNSLNIPIILSGGAGTYDHLLDAFKIKSVNAVSTANIFNFMGKNLYNARHFCIVNKVPLVKWSAY
jgi:cyclase